ncbi:MAG: BCCT family transporter [Desulfurivibrionaceae bacterium]
MIAAVLLVSGGLTALQAAVITAGMPFSVVMAVMAYSMIVALREEEAAPRRTIGGSRAEEPWTGRKEFTQKASG